MTAFLTSCRRPTLPSTSTDLSSVQFNVLRLMLVGVWLGLHWVLFYFFDHYVHCSKPRPLAVIRNRRQKTACTFRPTTFSSVQFSSVQFSSVQFSFHLSGAYALVLRLMLVGIWLGLHWVLFYSFDHYVMRVKLLASGCSGQRGMFKVQFSSVQTSTMHRTIPYRTMKAKTFQRAVKQRGRALFTP